MIRILPASLPRGLTGVIRRDPAGRVTLYYADWLPPQQRRKAVREAQRAARQRGWLRVLLPATAAAAAASHPRTFTAALLAAIAGTATAGLVTLPPVSPATRVTPAGRVSVTASAHQHRRRREASVYVPRPAPDPVPQRAPAAPPYRGAAPAPAPSPSLSLLAPVTSVTGLVPPPRVPVPSPALCVTALGLDACVSAAA